MLEHAHPARLFAFCVGDEEPVSTLVRVLVPQLVTAAFVYRSPHHVLLAEPVEAREYEFTGTVMAEQRAFEFGRKRAGPAECHSPVTP
ncbi:hypothetical protein [Streptomyces fractus]|uniref:hypothetical protein n=1 Tax=Streptomyces fractus TaxID=641806 RepID=UPI003CF2E043